jgi:XTP/dITP diphosphohydrolase
MGTAEILVATNNTGKLSELRRMLEPLGYRVLRPSDIGLCLDVPETGTTFEGNATIKAEVYRDAGGLLTLADDSGLVVDALDGEPGIQSARFGGPGLDDAGRVNLLLSRLRDVPDNRRTARFLAVIAVAAPHESTVVFDGSVDGSIALEASGENGFGYDPVFFYAPFGCTFGEAKQEAKDSVSHRGRAMRAAVDYLAGRQRERSQVD